MNLNDRIAKVIEHSGLTASDFADAIAVQRSNISHITSGRNKPSLDFIIKIRDRFPELNWDWLINGEGEMLAPATPPVEKIKPATLPDLFSLIDDDDFGRTESEDTIVAAPRDSNIRDLGLERKATADSQPLATKLPPGNLQPTENEGRSVKNIVFFYTDGKFEIFTP